MMEARDYTQRYLGTLKTEIEGVERATRSHLNRLKLLRDHTNSTAIEERQKAGDAVTANTACTHEFKELIGVAEKALAGFSNELAVSKNIDWKLSSEHVAHALLTYVDHLEDAHAKGPPAEGAFPSFAQGLHARRAACIEVARAILHDRK